MKFELKTENENYSKSLYNIFKTISILSIIIVFCNVSLKLAIISRNYQTEYNCRLLTVEKSKSNFKKLSKIFKLKSKQKIWELCRGVLK